MNISDQITTIVAFILFAILVFFFAITLAVRYRSRKRENEELKAKFTKERLNIQEETLKNVSRELHDNLGQKASLIKIHLNTLDLYGDNIETDFENIRDLTRQLIIELKLLSVRLNDDHVVQHGLLYAIDKEVNNLNRTNAFKAYFDMQGSSAIISAIQTDKAVILYRMVQETINNFIKHSKGTELNISILIIKKNIILEVKDNGRGFNVYEKQHIESAGLKNLKHRARLINASLDITSTIGVGTTITIKLSVI